MARHERAVLTDSNVRPGVMRDCDSPVVVKIGGSCAFSLDLQKWAARVAACAGRVVIVPGGGPFADAVRSAQPKMGFDDRAAHLMAMLAMEQFGRALASFDGRLTLADSTASLRRGLRERRVPVWLPSRMSMRSTAIPASWEVTSDSLAAWLAGKVRARRLLLMKQVELPRKPASADDLAERGIVDALFPQFLRSSGVAAFVLGPADHMAVADAICDDAAPGTPVVSR